MSEAKDPRGDDHIEELLSQLQGIFGKLSRSEEEESQAKIDPPGQTAPGDPSGQPLPPESAREPRPAPPPEAPAPEAAAPPAQPGSPTVPDAPMTTVPVPDYVPPPPPPPAEAVETPAERPPADFSALPMEADKSAVYSLIFYPPNRETEARSLTDKVQTMTPRFTKVAFQIKVAASIAIDPKVDAQETILPQVQEGIRAVFIIVDRPMDDARRKTITAALEPRGIYVHEVPALSVEKKAFYTDLLLGMVFFYDSLKSGAE